MAETFRKEVAWREFYADVLRANPGSEWESLNARLAGIPTDSGRVADERFEAWCAGLTGFPMVDAGMRQLAATGWMHNRVRMIVASFLVKDLHVPWQRGAEYFLRFLVDGDVASNNHNWQWVAGVGTDAAPYVRVFNPTSQGEKLDPNGRYVRRWVPELVDVPDKWVHSPADSPAGAPDGYPPPIVDHAAERVEALPRYDSVRRR